MIQLPSNMSQSEFAQVFGTIYEHSPWMAKQAHTKGLTSALNDYNSLCGYFNALFLQQPKAKQLEVVNAHPDLAGKLAINKQLTQDPTNEQKSAGLDQCTAKEFERFTQFNQKYKGKFGFPFIKAVKGQTRESILKEFEARLNNSYQQDFQKALSEFNKIAAFRLQHWFATHLGLNIFPDGGVSRLRVYGSPVNE